MHAALFALVIAATPYAPLGLRWGMSAREVVATLEPQFSYEAVTAVPLGAVAVWRGEFAGLPTETLSCLFTAHGLQSVWAQFSPGDPVPASKRYMQLMSKMTEAHGPPAKTSPAPRYLGARYDLLDRAIQKEEWYAISQWDLEGTTAVVSVDVGHPDKAGNVPMGASIMFVSAEAKALGQASAEARKSDL